MSEQDFVAAGGRPSDRALPVLHLLEEDLQWWPERARREVIQGFEDLLRKHAEFHAYLKDRHVPHM